VTRRSLLRQVEEVRGVDNKGRVWLALSCGHIAQRRRRHRDGVSAEQKFAYCRACSAEAPQ
jgi:hypothetical protein